MEVILCNLYPKKKFKISIDLVVYNLINKQANLSML